MVGNPRLPEDAGRWWNFGGYHGRVRGTEILSIDSLYAVEKAMWKYPGLRLVAIVENAVIGGWDEETGIYYPERNFWQEGLVVWKFVGPPVNGVRPEAVIPVSWNMMDSISDVMAMSFFDMAADSMIQLVADDLPAWMEEDE